MPRFRIDPPVPAVLTIQPPSMTGGKSATGTVTLNGQAPAGGTLVTLTSDNGEVSLPSSVTVVRSQTRLLAKGRKVLLAILPTTRRPYDPPRQRMLVPSAKL